MKTNVPILLFALLAGPPAAKASEVRVSLFGIFKPREVSLSGHGQVTVVAEDGRRRRLELSKLQIRCGGKSPVFLEAGSTRIGAGTIEVAAVQGLLKVRVPRGPEREYQGRIEIREQEGHCLIINHLPLNDYARDVACRELRGFGREALRAQGVLSRTFALTAKSRHLNQGFDLCDLTHCQVFTGPGACTKNQLEALRGVSGLALLYKGQPADVYYFSTCGGHTGAAADVWGPPTARPYLRGVGDGKPPHCAESNHMRWRFSVGRNELCRKLGDHLKRMSTGPCQIEIAKTGKGGWVKQVTIRGQRAVSMSGDNFHLLMGRIFGWAKFKSARFTLESSKKQFAFRGRGMGHGVGMCQYGAMGMDRAGQDFKTILKHYFPGTEVGRWP